MHYKYKSILFACGIAFLTLTILDTIKAQVKQFESFDDFFVDLQQTADGLVDFVRKVQVMLCPEQPVCGDGEEIEIDDVLETLPPTLTVGNVTMEVEKVRTYAGVCCLPCSCEDSCWNHENCCPTKQVLSNDNGSLAMEGLKTECVAATVKSHIKELFSANSYMSHMYRMTKDCFIDSANDTLLTRCQAPDAGQLDDTIPVTSNTTGITYWNRACAMCNDDDYDIMDWIPTVIMTRGMPYFRVSKTGAPEIPATLKQMLTIATSSRQADIIYSPPTSMEVSVCVQKTTIYNYCDSSAEKKYQALQSLLYRTCNRFFSPVYGIVEPFMNIFCLLCQQKLSSEDGVECRKLFGKTMTGFQGLLNYKRDELEDAGEKDNSVQDEHCSCTEIYDPYLHICRPTYCPPGEAYIRCQCIKILKALSGMPVLLKIKVVSESDDVNQLTDIQIRKLETLIKRAIISLAKFTSMSIGAMYQLNNDFLVIGGIKCDTGHDTKVTMEPLIKYLDTDEKITITSGKQTFSVTLSSKIAIWKAWETKYGTTFKVKDMETPNATYELISIEAGMLESAFGRGDYQVLSRLLYCKQIQLNNTEFFEQSGEIIANISEPAFSTFDYYQVTSTEIRVCADSYLQAHKENRKHSHGPKVLVISIWLMILSLTLALVL